MNDQKDPKGNISRFVHDNICLILVAVGCALGILGFFVDWEVFENVDTAGWAFVFGEQSDKWYGLIGNSCYIPITVFCCSVLSLCIFAYFMHRRRHIWETMAFCTVCGTVMLFSMTVLALTSFEFENGVVFFANFVGPGTYLSWMASVMIMIGGGMHIASHGRYEDGQ